MDRCLLFLGHNDGLTTATGGLGVLSTNTDTPVMTKTTMGSDLLQTFQIFTHFVVQEIGHNLVGLAVLDILLPVEEPIRDLVLPWVLHDGVWRRKAPSNFVCKALAPKGLHTLYRPSPIMNQFHRS